MISKQLVEAILSQYALCWNGIHDVSHWARVLENGQRLAKVTGANSSVVELFAVFHDSKRLSDGGDALHGQRGADFAASLRGSLFDLDQPDFDLLYAACAGHTDGYTQADITVQTCWDADRLDLGRAGIHPAPRWLCTGEARRAEVIAWADSRSRARFFPAWVSGQWGIQPSDTGPSGC